MTNYHSANWQPMDSMTSFYICSNSTTKLIGNDSIEIEYLGILQKDENLVIQNESDKAIFTLLTNKNYGLFKSNDTTLPKDIYFVTNQLTKNSEAIIKYRLGNIKPIEPDRKITVYFKSNIDSTKATNWINEFKKNSFVDSTYFLSKESALNNWSKDSDTTWKSFLEENPLPSSVDIFIKQSYFDTTFIHNLEADIMKSIVVSEVSYSTLMNTESLKEINQLMNNVYLIRIKPKE